MNAAGLKREEGMLNEIKRIDRGASWVGDNQSKNRVVRVKHAKLSILFEKF